MSIWNLKSSESATVKQINPELSVTFRDRLHHLGFNAGEQVICIRRTPFNGPRVYLIGDSVFSLAEDIATAVEIEGVGS